MRFLFQMLLLVGWLIGLYVCVVVFHVFVVIVVDNPVVFLFRFVSGLLLLLFNLSCENVFICPNLVADWPNSNMINQSIHWQFLAVAWLRWKIKQKKLFFQIGVLLTIVSFMEISNSSSINIKKKKYIRDVMCLCLCWYLVIWGKLFFLILFSILSAHRLHYSLFLIGCFWIFVEMHGLNENDNDNDFELHWNGFGLKKMNLCVSDGILAESSKTELSQRAKCMAQYLKQKQWLS